MSVGFTTIHGDYSDIDKQLAEDCSQFYADPLGWVLWAFDWGVDDLQGFDGPDDWQRDVLAEIGDEVRNRGFNGVVPVEPIREATASGHGIGKSAITSWIILWIMSTRPHAKGIVTANTSDQLRTKTWAELGKWRQRCIVGHWFEYNNGRGSMSLYHQDFPESWRVDAQTCREENSEAFAGLHAANSTPFYIFDEACHDDQTEVLTRTGWKLFEHVTPDDELITMNVETGIAYWDKPIHIHKTHYTGDMLCTETRGVNFCVTPNHRMLFSTRKRPDRMRFEEAGSMVWSNKKIPRHIQIKAECVDLYVIPEYQSARKHYASRSFCMDDWLQFLGWYLTEGFVCYQNGAPGMVVISQRPCNADNVLEIEQICLRLGYEPHTDDNGVRFYDPAVAAELHRYGKGASNKTVPDYVFDCSPRQIELFLVACVKGDGYDKGNGRSILYTSSESLADGYNRVAQLAGHTSVVTMRDCPETVIEGRTVIPTHPGYVVSIARRTGDIDADKARPNRIEYDGMVYCATISGGVLFTRRKGKVMWSGNSAVPDKIWEVAEGGLTDGEPMFFVFGNPTRNTGRFHACFNRQRHRWNCRQIDSRTAKMTNKTLIEQWRKDWGEDSDFFRVRVLGRFPKAGDMQLMPGDVVQDAMKRGPGRYLGDDPLVCGIDVARGGEDNCYISFRRGKDAKSEKVYRIPGEKSRDSMRVVSMITMLLERHKPDVSFIDETGLGGPIADRLSQLGHNVVGINFGSKADDDKHFVNKSAEMWYRMRQWLIEGGAIPDDPFLEAELTSREYSHNTKDQLVLERKEDMKKRGLPSPDWADSLALTFAQDVPPRHIPRGADYDSVPGTRGISSDYDPLDAI